MFTSQMWKRNTEYLLIICISTIFTTMKVNSVVSRSTQDKLQVFFQQSLLKLVIYKWQICSTHSETTKDFLFMISVCLHILIAKFKKKIQTVACKEVHHHILVPTCKTICQVFTPKPCP